MLNNPLTVLYGCITCCSILQLFVIPSLAALSSLIYLSQTSRHVWIAWVYGLSLTLLFLISTLFHLVSYIGHTGLVVALQLVINNQPTGIVRIIRYEIDHGY